jgi:hypothetical protein
MPAADIADIMVPQEDGAIQEALADLDRKLAVHAAAVREAEARLREIAETAGVCAPPRAEPAPQEETPPKAKGTPIALKRLTDVPAREPIEKAEPTKPLVEKTEPTKPLLDKTEPTKPSVKKVAPDESTVEPTPPIDPTPEPAALSDEEALLASLDEQTSKTIHVMRRLNPNRSVQDLLKQVEKQKDAAGSAAKPAAKSWFRRK